MPSDDFREVRAAVAEATFDGYEAYRAERGGTVLLVVAMLAEDAGRTVFLLYYRVDEAREMLARVAEYDEMWTRIRPLDDDEWVVFVQASPDALLPSQAD